VQVLALTHILPSGRLFDLFQPAHAPTISKYRYSLLPKNILKFKTTEKVDHRLSFTSCDIVLKWRPVASFSFFSTLERWGNSNLFYRSGKQAAAFIVFGGTDSHFHFKGVRRADITYL